MNITDPSALHPAWVERFNAQDLDGSMSFAEPHCTFDVILGSRTWPAADIRLMLEAAFSEPESRNVRHLLDTHSIDCFADVHSYSELGLYPWGHAPTQTGDATKRFTNPERLRLCAAHC